MTVQGGATAIGRAPIVLTIVAIVQALVHEAESGQREWLLVLLVAARGAGGLPYAEHRHLAVALVFASGERLWAAQRRIEGGDNLADVLSGGVSFATCTHAT